jgi:hypothetical protein
MKDLVKQMIQFSLIYGTRDRERFYRFAGDWLDSYHLDENTKNQVIGFVYDFLSDVGERMARTSIISGGIKEGVSSLEDKLEELNFKLEEIRRRLPETK